MYKNIAIIGAGGAIGRAFVAYFAEHSPRSRVWAFSHQHTDLNYPNLKAQVIELSNEKSVELAVSVIPKELNLDLIIVASGILHRDNLSPEKALRQVCLENMQLYFAINTIGPALVAKHFLPKFNRNTRSVMAVVSAAAGSISDNERGGWYGYRCSKAALNMMIKTLSIEYKRTHKQASIIALHPGFVNSKLSAPFQGQHNKDYLISAELSVQKMVKIIDSANVSQSGSFFDIDGSLIPF